MTAARDWSNTFAAAGASAMEVYDRIMVPRLFEPWANLLLDQLDLAPGQAVLDVATGPGTVARLAAQRVGPAGRVTACDLSPAMLAVARNKPSVEHGAPITYLERPADALGVPTGTFDVVTCQQGLQFFPNRPAALHEMRRALRANGKIGVAVWCAIGDSPPFEALAKALERVLGDQVATAYRGGPWGLSNQDELVRLIEGAGFTDIAVGQHHLPLIFEGGASQLLETLAAAGIAAQVAALDATGLSHLLVALVEAVRPITVGAAVRSEAAAHIATATAGR